MNAETFTERKTKLEEFYKQRIKFNIYSIDIHQANPRINIYDYTTNIFFKTRITFTGDKFLMSEFYTHLKPIIVVNKGGDWLSSLKQSPHFINSLTRLNLLKIAPPFMKAPTSLII